MKIQPSLDPTLFPGSKKVIINGPTYDPEQFCIDQFNKLPDNCDTVLFYTGDVWALHENKRIFRHPNILDKTFFLIGQGYQNRQLGPRQFEIASHSFYFSRHVEPMQIKPRGLDKGFGCLNNRASFARLLLGYKLWLNGLLTDMIFSQSTFDAWWTSLNQSPPEIVSTLQYFDLYQKLLPIKTDNDIDPRLFAGDHSINHKAHRETYCNIVTETESGDDIYRTLSVKKLEIITEKTYKPFISCQIPLILACPGHLQCLKEFGFEMMEDLLPAEFDSLGAWDKIDAITKIVSLGPEYIENFYFDHIREITHNYELVSSDKVGQQILSNIKNFIDMNFAP